MRCCHSGVRMPGRRRGNSRARAAASRNLAANSEVAPSCRRTRSCTRRAKAETGSASMRRVAIGNADHEAVVGPHGLDVEPALGAQLRRDGHAPWSVDAAAERSEHADAPVAEFVAADFDDDVVVARHARGCRGLLFQIAQQIFGGIGIEAVLFDELGESGRARKAQQFARHVADARAEFRGASGAVAVPERHLAGPSRRGRDDHAIVGDLLDAPGGGAENDGVADVGFRRPSPHRARRRACRFAASARNTP